MPRELLYASRDIKLANGDYESEKEARVQLYAAEIAMGLLREEDGNKYRRGGKPCPVILCDRSWLFPMIGAKPFFSIQAAAEFVKQMGLTAAQEPDSCLRTQMRRGKTFGGYIWRRLEPHELMRLAPKKRTRRPSPNRRSNEVQLVLFV